MDKRFEGKVVLVTGGSSGIGRACALAFGREGAKVILADMNVEGGNETMRMIQKDGGNAIFVRTDVSKGAEVEALVNKAVGTYGKLDCAFNNAGRPGMFLPLVDVSEEDWDLLIGVNLKGVWLGMKYEIPQMIKQGGGVIVNTSSSAGIRPATNHYGAAKWGVEGLTQGAAQLYGKNGVRVNAIRPSAETGFTQGHREFWLKRDPTSPYAHDPPGADPAIIAPAVLWLCSDDAKHVNGSSLSVAEASSRSAHG